MDIKVPPKFGSKNQAKYGMGSSVLRKEDAAFIKGEGCYTDDIHDPNQLVALFLRSPIAHANITHLDISEALALEGVHAILTHDDIKDYGNLPCVRPLQQADGNIHPIKSIPLLVKDKILHVGDAIAMVVADNLAVARDALELIELDFDMLDAVVEIESALKDDAPLVHEDLKTNQAFQVEIGDKAKIEKIFQSAPEICELQIINNRLVSNFMELRSAIGEWSDDEGYILTSGSQGVHGIRDILAKDVLKVDPKTIRMITPDVGGGFGTKVFPYREHALVLIAAKSLKRKIKWTCERSEHFVIDVHGRDNLTLMRMAMDNTGKFLALDVDLKAAMGAYLNCYGPFIPYLSQSILTGIYDIPAAFTTITGVYSHTVPVDAYRGAGRPEAIYALERLVDHCARHLGISVEEIRRRNAITPDQLPYQAVTGAFYDTGDFTAHMEVCMKNAKWDSFSERYEQAKLKGKIRGIGMSTYIEACAFPGSEPAFIELNEDGSVTILIGTQSNGQGHQTAYAQLAADVLSLHIDDVHVHQGDTARLANGGGTGGSRSIPLGGVSVHQASEDLSEKIKEVASDVLEASKQDLELIEGWVRVVGTDKAVSLSEIAKSAPIMLKGEGEFKQAKATYPNGTHICEVEIDPDTGECAVVDYHIVDDFGKTLNPLMLAGQVHGGVAQAIGQCLLEHTVYDDDGQLLSASFMDYSMPRADDMPDFKFETRNVPSTSNIMGMKGAGEAGTIGACPAVMNAVVDALDRAYGIKHIDMPATPHHIWQAIYQQKA